MEGKKRIQAAVGVATGYGSAIGVAAAIVAGPALERLAKGTAFTEGPKRPRRDALARLIDHALAEMQPEATAMDVLAKVAEIDSGRMLKNRVIQEIDRDDPEAPVIHWRAKGREKTTTFKSFQNRLTKRRKIIT